MTRRVVVACCDVEVEVAASLDAWTCPHCHDIHQVAEAVAEQDAEEDADAAQAPPLPEDRCPSCGAIFGWHHTTCDAHPLKDGAK